MKKKPSKTQLRQQIENQVVDYLKRGGDVVQVERGISGRTGPDGPGPKAPPLFQEPRAERTPLPEVVAKLEARRKPAPSAKRKRPTPPVPRRIPVYDDFGEIIRWVWEE